MQPADRLHALDALRAFALLAGIALHATMPFLQGVPGWVTTETPSKTLAAVWYIIHMFRMPVFFLIAGFFGRMLLERRGTQAFIRDRAKRILVPLVVGLPVVLLLTGVAFVLGALATGMSLSDLSALQSTGQEAGQQAAQSGPGLAHLWFLYYLAIFYVLALALRAVFHDMIDRAGKIRRAVDVLVRFVMRGIWGPLLLAIPLAAYYSQLPGWSSWTGLPAPFSFVPDVGPLFAYGFIFGFGWLLQRQSELLLGLQKSWVLYGLLAVVLTVVCRTIAGPTPRWAPYLNGDPLLIYSAAYMTATWCWSFALTGAAVRYLSEPSPLRRYIADSSYWLYLMHIPALILFDMLLKPFDLHWSVKYLLSIAGALPLLLLSYHYLVRPTFIGATLNGRRRPRALASALAS